MTYDVVVIGGGVSGLSTAYDLKKQGARVLVLERQARAGGNAQSERIRNGYLMEHGPSTMNPIIAEASDFSTELDLDPERKDLGDGVKTRYLVKQGDLYGVKVHPLAFLTAHYLSLPGRLRMMMEPLISRSSPTQREESIEQFVSRRFGREFSDKVMAPMVSGIFTGDAAELSARSVFPKLVEFEDKYGSVVRAIIALKGKSKMPGSRLFSWKNGIETLPVALSSSLGDALLTGITVRRISKTSQGFLVDAGRHGKIQTRAVVMATQPHVTAEIVAPLDDVSADALGAITAPPVSVVYLGYKREQVAHPLDGLGFLSSKKENRQLLGAQFCSTMFPGRAPEGHVSMAAYIGGSLNPHLATLPREQLVELAHAEFKDLLQIKGEPDVANVRQWNRGLPQYRIGHGKIIADIDQLSDRVPGLFATGNYMSGVSVACCLRQARKTASTVGKYLQLDCQDPVKISATSV